MTHDTASQQPEADKSPAASAWTEGFSASLDHFGAIPTDGAPDFTWGPPADTGMNIPGANSVSPDPVSKARTSLQRGRLNPTSATNPRLPMNPRDKVVIGTAMVLGVAGGVGAPIYNHIQNNIRQENDQAMVYVNQTVTRTLKDILTAQGITITDPPQTGRGYGVKLSWGNSDVSAELSPWGNDALQLFMSDQHGHIGNISEAPSSEFVQVTFLGDFK